ncbi:hypothetical protein [Bradymonas sediminis]|nr:hypothetical protein [Bradymonas sediminis]TDP76006.1 phosphomevalonate kinase [Bradymonas sediminis]
MLKTSAPGKLFLFGEYGVIRGGWCVVAAVDRRVVASRSEAASGYELEGADFDNPLALPEAVVGEAVPAEFAARAPKDVGVANLAADVRAVYDVETGQKLGLGSSAASAVALSAAFLLEDGEGAPAKIAFKEREAIFDHAFRAHRTLQKGRGSCADIAASTFGHVIGYRLLRPSSGLADLSGEKGRSAARFEATSRNAEAEVLSGLKIPEGLRVEPIWLGSPATSTSFVRACEVAYRRDPVAMIEVLAETSRIAEKAILALQVGDLPSVLACVERGDRAYDRLGALTGAPIITDAHRMLRKLAGAHGIFVKPSGAGGGDFSLAFAPVSADWAAFFRSLPASLRHLPLALGVPGVERH